MFNNYVKSVLINEYTRERRLFNLSVLDLCCGKGGDIPYKWKMAKISHYVGADLSRESVKSAKEKHEYSVIGDKHINDRRDQPFPAIFIVQDAGDHNEENLLDSILQKDQSLRSIQQRIMFDLVST